MLKIIAKRLPVELQDKVELLAKIKQELRTHPIAQEILEEHGFDDRILDGITVEFSDDIDSSAKTTNSQIQLNSNLINEDFELIMRYAIHELVHALQHMQRDDKDPYEGYQYLDRPDEVEAFQYQIEYESQEEGQEAAEEYVEELLNYHEIPESEQEEKRLELLNKT